MSEMPAEPAAPESSSIPAPEAREPALEPAKEAATSPREPVVAAPIVPATHEVRPAPRTPDPAEIQRALRDSGLEQVQTRPGITAEPSPEPEFVPAKRERRPRPADLEQPLEQVETVRKEDAPAS